MELLKARVVGNPYATDGRFAASIALLPPGLRAMAATHWLDISLTLDSITWHFGNFGESQLVVQTEFGLHELGLHELAMCFVEAKELMLPLLNQRTEGDGDPNEIVERAGLTTPRRRNKSAGVGNRQAWLRHIRHLRGMDSVCAPASRTRFRTLNTLGFHHGVLGSQRAGWTIPGRERDARSDGNRLRGDVGEHRSRIEGLVEKTGWTGFCGFSGQWNTAVGDGGNGCGRLSVWSS